MKFDITKKDEYTDLWKYTDPRTKKTFVVSIRKDISDEDKKLTHKYLQEKIEDDYQQTLPPEQRSVCNELEHFYCPFCKTTEKDIVKVKLFPVVHGSRFSISTKVIDTHKCHNCGNEFTQEKLQDSKKEVKMTNLLNLEWEKLNDGIISKEEYEYNIRIITETL
jgi:rubredoxin